MNLTQAIDNFIQTVPSDGSLTAETSTESPLFQNAILELQIALGQTDGGPAGLFFCEDKWFHDWYNMIETEDKIKLVNRYIAYELNFLPLHCQEEKS